MKRKRAMSVVKAAKVVLVDKAVQADKEDKEVRADQLAAKEAVLRVAVVHRPSSASVTISLTSTLLSEILETKLVDKQNRALTTNKKFILTKCLFFTIYQT